MTIPQDQDQSEDYLRILKENLKPVHNVDPVVLKFITTYIHCRDIGQSAKEAGITLADGRTLFNRADIFKTIEKVTQSAVVKYGYDASEVVERTKELAFSDPAELVTNDGTYIRNIKHIPPATRRAIKKLVVKNLFDIDANGISQYKGEIITYEFWDKPRSLELLGREKDTFKKTTVVEHDVSKNAREYLLASARMGEQAVIEMRDITPSQEVVHTTVNIPKPPGVK